MGDTVAVVVPVMRRMSVVTIVRRVAVDPVRGDGHLLRAVRRVRGATDETGQPRDLFPRGQQRRLECFVFVGQKLDFGLQLREPRFLALSAFERR